MKVYLPQTISTYTYLKSEITKREVKSKQLLSLCVVFNVAAAYVFWAKQKKVTLEMSPKLSLLSSHWNMEPTSHNQEGAGCQKQVSLEDVVWK